MKGQGDLDAFPTVSIRRVVTGHDADGRAVVVCDGLAHRTIRLRPGCETALIWTDQDRSSNNRHEDGSNREIGTSLSGGSVFRVIDYAPGVLPRWHRTHSTDYAVIISGEVMMELHPGDPPVHLKAGDVLVQRGTLHNWVNPGPGTCRIAFVLVGADPVVVPAGELPEEG